MTDFTSIAEKVGEEIAKECQKSADKAWQKVLATMPFKMAPMLSSSLLDVARASFLLGYRARVNDELDAIAEAKAKADA